MKPIILALLAALTMAGCSSANANVGTDAGATPGSVTEVTTSGGATVRCARPIDPEHLRDADLVFRGTVIQVSGGIATLHVDRTFVGDVGGPVRVRAEVPPEAMGGGATFTRGRSYLITVSDSWVADCLSGPADDPDLQKYYEVAFGG
ncbi:hypothetical protein KIH74_08980 [Kineosporia sp. J2-2]|uniref:Lipoprotein n=1 Tax=Kineosporia corallincola TaxID=2835133 RepID=A0ABS5TD99_9ACTN|nr:hypothetical protein [Kineosporia corallincola]MBT0769057.1 hypothetical protein [Kineosporia corallincola]